MISLKRITKAQGLILKMCVTLTDRIIRFSNRSRVDLRILIIRNRYDKKIILRID